MLQRPVPADDAVDAALGRLALIVGGDHAVAHRAAQLDPPAVGANLPRLEAKGSGTSWAYRTWARPAARVAAQLPLAFSRQVAVVQVARSGEIRLKMTTPVTFVLGRDTNLREKFVAVASVIAHQTLRRGAIVDVSVPSAVTIQ